MQSAMAQSKGTINAELLSEVFGYGENIISQGLSSETSALHVWII